MLPRVYHRNIFLFSTALLVIGMPTSFFILSVAQIILLINWLFEGNFNHKLSVIRKRKALLLIFLIYFIHLLGLLNTNDFFRSIFDMRLAFIGSDLKEAISNFKETSLPENVAWALHDIRIKLPILILPLVYGTSDPVNKKEFKIILLLFVATVLVTSIITTYILLGLSHKYNPADPRNASIYISHIRFSLLIVLSIFSLVYLSYSNKFSLFRGEKILSAILLLWFSCFLIMLKSVTGIVILLILAPPVIIWAAHFQKKLRLMKITYVTSILFIISVVVYFFYAYSRYSFKEEINTAELQMKTVNGNNYMHNIKNEEFENEFRIWVNVCEKELKKEWNRRSIYNYDSFDRKDQHIRITLIRYLTSMGLTKDSVGVSLLDEKDITMIENGNTNYLNKNKFSLYPKIYELFWQIEKYHKGYNPSGHSLTQRIEYIKTGIHIIQDNIWFGTGTGDIKEEYRLQYERDDSQLSDRYRLRAHNQFLTFFISFGVFGFLCFCFALFYAPVLENRYRNFLFMVFFLISILSMLNEDTLETHVGVSFFSFFYAFFLFSMPENESE